MLQIENTLRVLYKAYREGVFGKNAKGRFGLMFCLANISVFVAFAGVLAMFIIGVLHGTSTGLLEYYVTSIVQMILSILIRILYDQDKYGSFETKPFYHTILAACAISEAIAAMHRSRDVVFIVIGSVCFVTPNSFVWLYSVGLACYWTFRWHTSEPRALTRPRWPSTLCSAEEREDDGDSDGPLSRAWRQQQELAAEHLGELGPNGRRTLAERPHGSHSSPSLPIVADLEAHGESGQAHELHEHPVGFPAFSGAQGESSDLSEGYMQFDRRHEDLEIVQGIDKEYRTAYISVALSSAVVYVHVMAFWGLSLGNEWGRASTSVVYYGLLPIGLGSACTVVFHSSTQYYLGSGRLAAFTLAFAVLAISWLWFIVAALRLRMELLSGAYITLCMAYVRLTVLTLQWLVRTWGHGGIRIL